MPCQSNRHPKLIFLLSGPAETYCSMWTCC
jgi:hypothetical protein